MYAKLSPGSPAWWSARATAQHATRGRPGTNIERILNAALDCIDEVGIEAFTLRKLAAALGTGTATLYRRVGSKDELLALAADKILGEIEPPAVGDVSAWWLEGMLSSAEALHDVLRRHPRSASLLASQVPVGPNGLRLREGVLRLLQRQGFSVTLSARAYTAVAHYVVGFAIQQAAEIERGDARIELRDYYDSLDPKQFACTRNAAHDLLDVDREDEFRFGLNLLLEGLGQLAQRPPSHVEVRPIT